jgi:phosphoserine aminotransferase
MITFYPGPSKVYDQIPQYVADAHRKGILSINHRSAAFMEICDRTIALLKDKLNIPKDYTIFFTTSATECWEIIAQSLVVKDSHHVYNGAFGEKWFQNTKRLHKQAWSYSFDSNSLVDAKKLSIPSSKESVVCLTQNETSNGTQLSSSTLRAFRKINDSALIAVDATSSMAGIHLPIKTADVWYASVQKCFGLPAGLAVVACSKNAVNRAKEIQEQDHYNSLTSIIRMIDKRQTTHTPNVLGIYLLMRVLEKSKNIDIVDEQTTARYHQWMDFLGSSNRFNHLIKNPKAHSYTVLPIEGDPDFIKRVKIAAKKKNIILGEGYGAWKETTFRIANFPAIKNTEIKTLQRFLKSI